MNKFNQDDKLQNNSTNYLYSLSLLVGIVISIVYLNNKVDIPPLHKLFSFSNSPDVAKMFFIFIFILCLAYIFYLVTFLRPNGLEKSKFDIMHNDKKGQFTNWEWSHIFTYFIFALLCPNDWKFVFIIGMTYEIFELIVGFLSGDQSFWTSQAQNLISFGDIKANLLGYGIGHVVKSFF